MKLQTVVDLSRFEFVKDEFFALVAGWSLLRSAPSVARSKCQSPPIAVAQISHYFLPYTEEYEGIDKPAVYYLGDN